LADEFLSCYGELILTILSRLGQHKKQAGFTLIEIVVVIALVAILASISMLYYLEYIKRARAASCYVTRRQAKMDEIAYNLDQKIASLKINPAYRCPSGGVFVWMVWTPGERGYPKLGCSVHYASNAPAVEEDNILFATDFESMSQLTPKRGKWDTQNGQLIPLTSGGERQLFFGDPDLKNYQLDMTATLSKGNGYGVFYRASGEPATTGYVFQVDPGYGAGAFLVREWNNNRESSPIQRIPFPEGFDPHNTAHNVSISVDGSQHTITVDGITVMDFEDDTFTSGGGGIRLWDGSDIAVDSATISKTGQ
jgi:prepilin-type N-terminal cleavage/methylation domain-containing protein